MTEWPIDQLKPYHRQEVVFPESKVNPVKRQALYESIAHNGLDRPIRITRDGTIIDGFHRWHIGQELGWDTIPVDVLACEPDSPDAQRIFLESNVGSVHDDPIVQARLLQERVKLAGIQRGGDRKSGSKSKVWTLKDVAQSEGVSRSQLANQLSLNKLIPPLQALVSGGTFNQSQALALAGLPQEEQQSLYDTLGDGGMARIKAPDIQQAKQSPDTSRLEARLAKLESERDSLQAQVDTAEVAMADTPDPSLLEALKVQLTESEVTRQSYADELARLKAQGPVERIVEKVITVEKPIPTADPAQAALIGKLEADLTQAQARIDRLIQAGDARRDLDTIETQRKEAEKALRDAKAALTAVYQSTEQQTGYRAAVGKFVEDATKRARPIVSDWQRIAEHPKHPLNWGLYYDVQALAGMLESVAAGLRLLELDPKAAQKRQQHGVIVDTTATVTMMSEPEEHPGGMIDVHVTTDSTEH